MSHPYVSVSFTAKRPGPVAFSSDETHITLSRIPVGASQEVINEMLATAQLTSDMVRNMVYRRIGEAELDLENLDLEEGENPFAEFHDQMVEVRLLDESVEQGWLETWDANHILLSGQKYGVLGIESVTRLKGSTVEVTDAQAEECARLAAEIPDVTAPEESRDIPPPNVTPIPSIDDVKTSVTAFGIEVRFPSESDRHEPITTGSDESAGQLKTLCTLIGSFDLTKSRHTAANVLLEQMGEEPLGPKPSFNDLDKAQAGMLLDWLYSVATESPGQREVEALSMWRAAINAREGQGALL